MVAFNKVEGFVGYLGTKVIDLNADALNVYASNATPDAGADDVKANLAEITVENGYTGPLDTVNVYSEAGGTGTMTSAGSVVWTATPGGFGPLQYIALYDDTVSSPVVDPLLGWWDYGSAVSPADTETFTVTFGASLATII